MIVSGMEESALRMFKSQVRERPSIIPPSPQQQQIQHHQQQQQHHCCFWRKIHFVSKQVT